MVGIPAVLPSFLMVFYTRRLPDEAFFRRFWSVDVDKVVCGRDVVSGNDRELVKGGVGTHAGTAK